MPLLSGSADGKRTPMCRLCGKRGETIFEEERVPILVNAVYDDLESAIEADTWRLEWRSCGRCGFLWNAAHNKESLAFDSHYENEQATSVVFQSNLRRIAETLAVKLAERTRINYLEIGCGQGSFIKIICEVFKSRIATVEAFEPAWRQSTIEANVSVEIYEDYFSPDSAKRLRHPPDLVVLRHSLEYFDDPAETLRVIKSIAAPGASIFIETPSADVVMNGARLEDLAYERQSLFGRQSLYWLFAEAKLPKPEIEEVFFGQYLTAFGPLQDARSADVTSNIVKNARHSSDGFGSYRTFWRAALSNARSTGKCAIWGAGGKGAMFCVLNDPERALLECAIDINPLKQGKFMPTSGLEVVSPMIAAQRELRTIFVMNAAYFDEIQELACAAGLDAALVRTDQCHG